MSESLGRATLELEANVAGFERNVGAADEVSDRLKGTLEALASIADAAQHALNDVKLSATHAATSRVSAEQILAGVRGIGRDALEAAHELDRVKLGETQATETEIAGGIIDTALNRISRNADEAKRKLLEVKLAGGRNGVGVGPFGSGFGRIGVLGSAIGLGALAAPAAAPAALGVLAGIPTMAAGAVGALGTLALAFKGVGQAIGGSKKAFDDLGPSAQQFVLTVRSLDGWFDKLRQTAGAALFPGLTAGLKAALSVGTVNAITTAVTELGHALGSAGAAWGKYFGSARFQQIFGPLMQSAARNIGVLSDAFLHLFDAFGVLARAAIPFTNWLNTAIDRGAKFADTWLRARDATGQLGTAMREAQVSLRLVGGLAASLFKVIFALGHALYPVSKVALKDLIDGLNGLAGVIRRNEADIRGIVGGALKVFVFAVKTAADGVGFLWHSLEALIGHKAMIVAAIAAIGVVLAASLGPYSAAITGAIFAVGLIKDHWRTVKTFFVNLGHEIVNAFKYAWYQLEKGALKAALAVVEPFSHLPSFLGGWARKAKDSMQGELDRLRPPNMAWGSYAEKAGAYDGVAWRKGFASGIAGAIQGAVDAVGQAVHDAVHHHHKRRRSSSTDPTLPAAPQPTAPVFGTPPPFTSTGSTSRRRHHLTAAQRRQEALQFALDRAKEAVMAARQGSKAYDQAVVAEKKALRDEIRYWANRAHNLDLSLKVRDEALRKELAYQKQLKSLTKTLTQSAAQARAENEAQFLSSFADIQNTFSPNTAPLQPPAGGGKATTHLYEIRNELRQQTPLLKKAAEAARFPGSAASQGAAMAVAG